MEDMRARGRRGFYFQALLGDPEAPRVFIQSAIAAMGGADILVSNAGRNVFRGLSECTERDWNDSMSLDLASHWRLARSAEPALRESGHGVVILISSNHAFNTLPGSFPYNVAKAGMNAMVQSMALEWGPEIRAVSVAPGFIDTPGNDTWFATFPDPAAKRAEIEAGHPAGRIGTPDEIGALCAFLASDHARFITGTTLVVDGGHGADMGW
jgi:NAD(P)-dependent dehydrogenase (short-subunit alcohol dehydrogenase family)